MTDIIRDPQAIETKSFVIIDAEVGTHRFSETEWPIVRRIVHTSADFDFVMNTLISEGAVDSALQAISQGCGIYCDTNMVLSGVRLGLPMMVSARAVPGCHVRGRPSAPTTKPTR